MKKIFALMVSALVAVHVHATDNITLHTFNSGETISSSKMNENFSFLNNKINNLSSNTSSSSGSVPKYIITGGNQIIMQSNDGLSWSDRKNSGSGIEFNSWSHKIGSKVFSNNSGDIWFSDDFLSFDVVENFYINRQNSNNTGHFIFILS